jgi:hypothetical protein
MVTGNTPDISVYIDYSLYTPVWYYDNVEFPDSLKCFGRWHEVAHRAGQALCYWILTITGQVITRTTVQPIPSDELLTDTFK